MSELKGAIGYIRVSTKQQGGEDKFGVEAQREAIERYAAENGYKIIDWKEDKKSGLSDDRPAMNEILYGNKISNPPVEAVIVFKNDRVARDTKLYFYYLYVLEKKGIKLLSTKEEFDEGDDLANVYRALMQFVAEQERKNITLRTGRGRSIKANYGGYSGGRYPYGYKVVDHKLVINEEERPIVETVFEQYNQGTPMLSIAAHLNKLGYKTRTGGMFYASSIKSILANQPFYEGKYRYGKMNEWVEGEQEPILKPVGNKKIKLA